MNYLQLNNIKCTILRHSLLKSALTFKPGLFRGHSRSLEMTPFYRSHMILYSCSLSKNFEAVICMA